VGQDSVLDVEEADFLRLSRQGPPSLMYSGYQFSFLGVKQLRPANDHPSPFVAKIEERVALYLFSPSGPS